jgi:hypothetical protein
MSFPVREPDEGNSDDYARSDAEGWFYTDGGEDATDTWKLQDELWGIDLDDYYREDYSRGELHPPHFGWIYAHHLARQLGLDPEIEEAGPPS